LVEVSEDDMVPPGKPWLGVRNVIPAPPLTLRRILVFATANRRHSDGARELGSIPGPTEENEAADTATADCRPIQMP